MIVSLLYFNKGLRPFKSPLAPFEDETGISRTSRSPVCSTIAQNFRVTTGVRSSREKNRITDDRAASTALSSDCRYGIIQTLRRPIHA